MDGTQNPTNSTKISTMHARWIGHLYSLVLELSLAAGKSSWAPLRPLRKAAVPHGTCHFWLPSSGKGCASAQPGRVSWPWAGFTLRYRGCLGQEGSVNGQLCPWPAPRPSLSAPWFPPASSINMLFRKILLCKEWCQVTRLVNCVTRGN